MTITGNFDQFKEAMLALPADRKLGKEDLLVDDFLMHRHGKLEMYYAPHNEYVNAGAKVMMIGITPGWNQMRIAFQAAREGLEQGMQAEEICRNAKEEASFAGTMRCNLVNMLDQLELPYVLGMKTSEELFLKKRNLLHTTSLLRYPVFVDRHNYSGKAPHLVTTPFLREYARLSISEELGLLERVLIIPLGKTVEAVLYLLVQEGKVDERQCVWGFPHPSGANGHRQSQFLLNFKRMQNSIRKWF